MPAAIYLRDLSQEELEALFKSWEIPRYRTVQLLEWMYKHSARSWEAMKNLPKELISQLKEKTELNRLEFILTSGSSNQESMKFLTKTVDGHFCESVLISQSGRDTVCVSTQLGCKVGCVFCASGKGRFGRNLSAGEIVEQISVIENYLKKSISNVVFMGMGEPLDNYDNVMKAITIMEADWGIGLGGRRITVSTSGITPKIESFVQATDGRVRLSVSLHSANNDTRTALVPINKKYNLPELIKTLHTVHEKLRREITFEYTLIDNVNDSAEEAHNVAKISSQLNAKVNLIPYNPIREMDFKTPSKERIQQFVDILKKKGIRVTVRQTAGRDIDAACGQLRLDRESLKV